VSRNETRRPVSEFDPGLRTLATRTVFLEQAVCAEGMFRKAETELCIDAPLRVAAQRKVNSYRQHCADNQNISFLPAIVSTSTRMHGELAHRETEAHFTAAGMSSQRNQSDSFRFKRAAFY
jgi:hypothetical protein